MLIARTDADAANLLLSDIDDRDKPFLTGERTPEGFFRVKPGIDQAIARGLAYAPYCDLIWCETSHPSLEEAEAFADGDPREVPGQDARVQLLAVVQLEAASSTKRRSRRSAQKLFAMGYRFQFITLAGWHALNHSMFELAHDYSQRGMAAYADFQEREFASEGDGYTATRHQREVGTGYFDEVAKVVGGGKSSTTALTGSTEEAQFHRRTRSVGANAGGSARGPPVRAQRDDRAIDDRVRRQLARAVLAERDVEALARDARVARHAVLPEELRVAAHHHEIAVRDVDRDRVVAQPAVFLRAQLEGARRAERERSDDQPRVALAVAIAVPRDGVVVRRGTG